MRVGLTQLRRVTLKLEFCGRTTDQFRSCFGPLFSKVLLIPLFVQKNLMSAKPQKGNWSAALCKEFWNWKAASDLLKDVTLRCSKRATGGLSCSAEVVNERCTKGIPSSKIGAYVLRSGTVEALASSMLGSIRCQSYAFDWCAVDATVGCGQFVALTICQIHRMIID